MSRSLWTPLHAQLHRTIRQRQLLEKHQAILVAVSGGQDSLCLIKLLLDLQLKWNWRLAIVHCDHGWRADSQANAEYVEKLAANWQLPFYLQTADSIPTSEAEARRWRYEWFQVIAERESYSAIVTGHTASDRAETLLFNLIRGSGTDGLQSLAWQRFLTPTVKLIRPLLEVTRTETVQFCQDAQLRVWEDSTNQDVAYARNRIRHELLPYLKTHFNPQTEQHLAQTMELLSADVEYLEKLATELREKATWNGPAIDNLETSLQHSALSTPCFSVGDSHHSALNRQVLRSAPISLQRRAVRQFLQQTLQFNPNFEHIEKFTALITAPNRSRTDPFQGKIVAEVDGDWIWLKTIDL